MKIPRLRTLGLMLALAALAVPGTGAPRDPIVAIPLDLSASAPSFRAAESGEGLVPFVSGFGRSSRPGEPMLPLRILLVAIPEGVVPTLRIVSSEMVQLTGLDLAPVPGARLTQDSDPRPGRLKGPGLDERARDRSEPDGGQGLTPIGLETHRDRLIYGRDAFFPDLPVRLGRIGYLRDQRFVEVIYLPLSYNAATRQGRFFPKVRAEVRFETTETPAAAPAAFQPDPLFEDTYRASLVNYEQGKLFRALSASAVASRAVAIPAAKETASGKPADAGTPGYKLMVSQSGVFRLDHAYLSAHAPDLLALDPRTLSLQTDGAEIPISIQSTTGGAGEADGTFDPDDVLEFVGKAKTEPATVLNYDYTTTFPDIYQANDFTDTQVYWLSASGSPGSHPRVPSVDGTPSGGFAIAPDFQAEAVWEENNLFLPTGAEDPYFSSVALVAGGAQAQRDLPVALPGLASSGIPADVTIRVRGSGNPVQNPDHRVGAWVNGDSADTVEYSWDGETVTQDTFHVAQSLLTDPSTVHLKALGLAGVASDVQFIDKVTLSYRRTFVASGGALAFSYPNTDVRFVVGGLAGTPPSIYEITDSVPGNGEASPVQIVGAEASGAPTSIYTFEVAQNTSPSAPAVRSFVVATTVGYKLPDAIVAAAEPVLRVPGQAADILVIGSAATLNTTPGGPLDLLLAHRLSAQGLTSRVIDIAQVYDEFSSGRRDPNAIQSFLGYAYDHWRGPSGTQNPPSFVLLVGDSTADYKNNQSRADWVDQVPTPILFQVNSIIGYYSSDNLLASFHGADQIPDIYLGRISARSADIADGVFDKIRHYEESPPPGLWKGRALLTSGDGRSEVESQQFEAVQTGVASSYFSLPPYAVPSPPLYYAEPPWNSNDPTGFRGAITAELNSGDALFSFVGHGSFDGIGLDDIFNTDHAAALTNTRLPLFVAFDCLAGGFHSFSITGALSEAMVNNPIGGSIAAIAPSGLSNALVGDIMSQQLYGRLFGGEKARLLGKAQSEVHAAVWSLGMIGDAQSLTFLGDPATILTTPAPPPPSGLTAAAGNAQVTLSWTPPATPVAGYRVYRATTSPTATYSVVCTGGAGATGCVDSAVTNATRYYYYAVSIDSDQFEGPVTNFNTDCDAGPGCVTARPLNPNPPSAPTGILVQDPGTGGVLKVSWTPNPESDIKQYTVHYGTVPGVYPLTNGTSGAQSSINLFGLADSVRYYVVVTAGNTSNLESAPSAEESGVSHLIQGIAPPLTITDLKLSVSGPSLVLNWSQPTVDIYGRPTTVTGYRVYRGTTPGYVVAGRTPIATINSGATTTYTDPGAYATASNFYYVVTANDTLGYVSGAGRELPNGIMDLDVSSPSTNQLQLTWSPITTDMQGFSTLVHHYQIHATATPVPRQSLGTSTLLMDNVTSTSVLLTVTASPRYFSVLAVDNRGNLSPF